MSLSPVINYRLAPSRRVKGEVRVPGDKSISHRAVMLGAIAQGTTRITGILDGEDNIATLNAFRAMGIEVEEQREALLIHGRGLNGLQAPSEPIDLGNSGTSMRLLAGLLSAQPFNSMLVGDASLSQRPMRRITDPLRLMGAQIESEPNGTPPLRISPATELQGITYHSPVASAQVKSSLLLAALYAKGAVTLTEPQLSRDHTERMLTAFGYPITRSDKCVALVGGGALEATSIDIPADISSAAFFIVAATLAPEPSELLLPNVGINPTRTGIISLLNLMGAKIELLNQREVGGEPRADLRVRSAPLKGISIPKELIAAAIDEFPALFIAAAAAEGVTTLEGAEELRIKESDRIAAMAEGLQTLGVKADPTADGMVIYGQSEWRGGRIETFGDHRIAMAFATASLRANAPIELMNSAHIQVSFPNFVELANQVGMKMEQFNE